LTVGGKLIRAERMRVSNQLSGFLMHLPKRFPADARIDECTDTSDLKKIKKP